jgi:hypothetical protein
MICIQAVVCQLHPFSFPPLSLNETICCDRMQAAFSQLHYLQEMNDHVEASLQRSPQKGGTDVQQSAQSHAAISATAAPKADVESSQALGAAPQPASARVSPEPQQGTARYSLSPGAQVLHSVLAAATLQLAHAALRCVRIMETKVLTPVGECSTTQNNTAQQDIQCNWAPNPQTMFPQRP